MSKMFAAAVALALTLSFAAPAAADSGKGKDGGKTPAPARQKVEGTVTAVDAKAGTVTITTRGGTAVQLTVSSSTKIERNDRHTSLATFKVGDRGQAEYAAGGAASKVEATGQ